MISKKKRLITLLSLIAIVLIGIYFAWSWVFRIADSSVAGQKAVVEISAPALLSSFETNETLANQKYSGKVIAIEGTIAEINKDEKNTSVYLKESNATSGVMCSFQKKTDKLKDFQIGQNIKIKGICNGYLMDVQMNKCALDH
jgi:hypothetical protein